jgi:alpha-galactosidase
VSNAIPAPTIAPIIRWGHSALECVFLIDDRFAVSLVSFGLPGLYVDQPATPELPPKGALVQPLLPQPFVEIFATGNGHRRAGSKSVDSVVGARLRYFSHRVTESDGWTTLEFLQTDELTGLTVTATLTSPVGVTSVTTKVTLTRPESGTWPISLEFIGVAAVFGAKEPSDIADLDILVGENDWLAEGRWKRSDLRERGLPNLNLGAHPTDPKGAFWQASTGTWSTGRQLPTGFLVNRVTGLSWGWQVETNGAWRWEVGERRDGAYLLLSGPNDRDHQWNRILLNGESFTTVPVTIVRADSFDGVVATLTAFRRRARRSHPDNAALPVVFNDYMNTLMGDPTTGKLLPLIDAAAATGAEIFCVDAGWYDDTGEWWDGVGEWMPSTTRFPGGLGEVLDHIRGAGMVPGLWLEPEVIGVNSVMATRLPDEAFLQRHGIRVREHDRFHLDFRHPAAIAHLDSVVDRIVGDYGVGYIKLDYNIDAGPGTDWDTDSSAPVCLTTTARTLRGSMACTRGIQLSCSRIAHPVQCAWIKRCSRAYNFSRRLTSRIRCATHRSLLPRRLQWFQSKRRTGHIPSQVWRPRRPRTRSVLPSSGASTSPVISTRWSQKFGTLWLKPLPLTNGCGQRFGLQTQCGHLVFRGGTTSG